MICDIFLFLLSEQFMMTEPPWNWLTNSSTYEAASHQLKKTSTHGKQRHGQLSIGFRSYGNQTWPIKWNEVSSRLRSCQCCCMDALLEHWLNGWKKLDGNYTRMLRAILNKSWQQHPTRRQLYGHLPPVTKTIQARQTRHAGHCWRSKDEIVSDVLLWTPAYGQAKAGRPARTYIQQLCDDMGCNLKDLLEAMNDRETWRERVGDIRASRTTWWWLRTDQTILIRICYINWTIKKWYLHLVFKIIIQLQIKLENALFSKSILSMFIY